ncbi:protein kinase [Aerosakkonemataceae cyanobacterium BLCC-F154]|uniref:non-specific serine/threonine protein kinase n=1 Tax=Floridaenema fluviatile BLCC-F154 TaxID=3153640 RepID=A0ABV4YHI8_9CYAN
MIGELIQGRYFLYKQLGRGGFGETYLAKDQFEPQNSPCVVKKIMLPSNEPDVLEKARMRFEREAEALKKLGIHPQIPKLYTYFEREEEFYLVQEYINGDDLKKEIKEGETWSEYRVIQFLKEVLKILEFVHQEGIIHRDVNPKNLIRRKADGKLVLIDFGAVKDNLGASPRNIKSTMTVGTPGYMPNEQAGGSPKLCSDIYAVGMMGIQALTGLSVNQLEEDPHTAEIVWKHRAKISKTLEVVLEKMVRSYFRDRYQSAIEALTALNKVPIPKPEELPSLVKNPRLLLPKKLPKLPEKLPELGKKATLPLPENPPELREKPVNPPPAKPQRQTKNITPNSRLMGRYEIIQSLGSGMFGKTYLARDEDTKDKPLCVVKIFQLKNLETSALPAAREIFKSQVKVLYELAKNPEFPTLLNHFEVNQQFYLILEFIPGNSLAKELITGQALSMGRVYELLREILEVLAVLHKQNIIHGNLSCQHLLRREADEKLVLIDFGMIKQINTVTNSAASIWEISASGYVAPEQKQGNHKLNSDLYAVGMMGIQGLTGLPPRLIQQRINAGEKEFNWRNAWQEKSPEIIPEMADILDKMISPNWEERYQSATEALRAWKKLSDSWLGIGNTLCFKKKFAEAIASYNEILKKMPEFYRAWHQKGKALAKWGKYQEAIESFQEAIKINPKYYNSFYEIGNVLIELHQYESAINKYEKALQIKMDFAEAWYAKGKAWLALEDWEKAIAAYEAALHIQPEYYEAKCGIGDIKAKLQQFKAALAAYEDAITIKKACCHEAWYGKAQMLEALSNYEAALKAYQKATEMKDRHHEAWYGRGKMLEQLADYETAIRAYKKAVQIQPNFTLAIEALERLENRNTLKWLRYFNKFPNPLRKNDYEN